jgi:tripartite-type tricarboxylate transporter receptor subunit TctC
VPPIADALPGYELSGTEWLMAPAGTPQDILARLNSAVTTMLETSDMKALWATKGNEFTPNSSEQAAAKFRQEYERVAAMIKEAGVKPEF